MITSINGLSNTSIQETTIQKENIPKDTKDDEKAKIEALWYGPVGKSIKEIIDIDENEDNWVAKTISKIDNMLSKRYNTEQDRNAMSMKQPKTLEEAKDQVLIMYSDILRENSVDGKPTMMGKLIGLGTKEEEADLRAFMDSMSSLYPNENKESLSLLDRTDLSIDEFKTLFAKAREKATKDVEEQRKQIIKEEQEYNANFAKEQSEKKFKPMQVKKEYETYDINKDQKFLYARELLNFKEKRDIDVLELMQKIDKKQILNKMA
ncbi:cell surface protein [Campylobacter concisus]|uniref:cell surface protein n=1 Tax=Campylobacter concisus TaxID=199 RepID=UPI000CD8D90E|nr:cell surface protein [Campylobacter concisus]